MVGMAIPPSQSCGKSEEADMSMANPVEALLMLTGACFVVGSLGASFTLGVALVCRWLEWAPVNTKVIINMDSPADRNTQGK